MLPVCGFDSGAVRPGLQLRALLPTLPAGGDVGGGPGRQVEVGAEIFSVHIFLKLYTHTKFQNR